MVLIKTSSALALLSAASSVDAFWRMQCKGRTGTALVDPIVDFGKVADHAHAFHGSSAIAEDSTYADLRAGNCTSCAVKQDMSAYWFPTLYFQDSATNKFEPVPQVGGLLAYYLLRNGNTNQQITAFPPGFRMLAGTSLRRDYTLGDPDAADPPTSDWAALGQVDQDSLAQRALGFNCMDYSKTPEPSLYRHKLPDKAFTDGRCKDGLRLEIMFPSCWNGENDSPNHKSHVAYPSLVGDGSCPEGFSKRLVTLFFEVIWATNAPQFQGRAGRWVLANGDPTGYGNHADFFNGWDEGFLQQAINRCTNPSGVMSDCPQFMENGPLQDEPTQDSCRLADTFKPFSAFDVSDGVLAGLPGGVQVQAGPQSATPKGSNILASILQPLIPEAAVPTAAAPSIDTNLPAEVSSSIIPDVGIFQEVPTSSSTSTPPPPPPPTTTAPPPPPPAAIVTPPPAAPVLDENGNPPVSTRTITKDGMVQEIIYYEDVVYVTEEVVTTTTVAVMPLLKTDKMKHRRNHLMRNRHI
ncbi:uncharacterized protein B0I36DRAFT_320768 [Microdochium trichocladiopsis]|uniref:DUF1996 domain-containing protein n=1 Tax=Microdochium trichocladiopsis TaxID=1682393 RepID=A0A9P8Y9C4_9PEZI|nr:uncharacterized protein B0I36DRAFT_320768 [Microdochium trichocladiopsis]KAH7033096.1 hypothetical protein B0I36DRAFT_320768 [Microdochium trichocladiopsis]